MTFGDPFEDSGVDMAHTRLSRPDSGLGFQVKVLKTFQMVPSSLGSGHAVSDPVSSRKLKIPIPEI